VSGSEQNPASSAPAPALASAPAPATRPAPPGWEAAGGTELDVRFRRTRSRLQEAVLRLAAERPVEEISVADLVRAARVNRATFYHHAQSPSDVLAQALYADLDRIRAGWLAETALPHLPTQESWQHAAHLLLDHLDRHDAVYTRGLAGPQPSAVLQHLLVDHFAVTLRALIDRNPLLPLPGQAGPDDWRAQAYSSFVAHGEVGIVAAWLALPLPRERSLFVSAATVVLPEWLTAHRPQSPRSG
jgi:AcrR family transcriptional regulator